MTLDSATGVWSYTKAGGSRANQLIFNATTSLGYVHVQAVVRHELVGVWPRPQFVGAGG